MRSFQKIAIWGTVFAFWTGVLLAALPATLDPTKPLGSDLLSQGDNEIRDFKQLFVDLFGIPTDPTSLTKAIMDVGADGAVADDTFCFEGTTDDGFEICLGVVDPTADANYDLVGANINNVFTGNNTLSGANTFSGNNLLTASNTAEGPVNYSATTTAQTMTAGLTPALTSYDTGAQYHIKITDANSATDPTINIDSLGAKTIKRADGTALNTGELSAGSHVDLRYDGTNMLIVGWGAVSTGRLETPAACDSGYTEIRGWCMDTDGNLSLLYSTATDESAFTARVVHADAKMALLRVFVSLLQDGTGESANALGCTIPGDSGVTTCTTSTQSAHTGADLANEKSTGINDVIVQTDSSGQVKTFCELQGTVTGKSCSWYIVGYMP